MQIDDAAWNEGRRLFSEGYTIRQMAESITPDDPQATEADELRQLSRVVGFADAFLVLLRGR